MISLTIMITVRKKKRSSKLRLRLQVIDYSLSTWKLIPITHLCLKSQFYWKNWIYWNETDLVFNRSKFLGLNLGKIPIKLSFWNFVIGFKFGLLNQTHTQTRNPEEKWVQLSGYDNSYIINKSLSIYLIHTWKV